jgi:hypothetical protein
MNDQTNDRMIGRTNEQTKNRWTNDQTILVLVVCLCGTWSGRGGGGGELPGNGLGGVWGAPQGPSNGVGWLERRPVPLYL